MDDRPILSATQIKLWNECQRKWGFKYLERLPDPAGPGALLGTEVQDTQLDPWLGEGRAFDFTRKSGEIAQAIAPLLPPPMAPGMRLRVKFEDMPSPTGKFGYRGEFDIWGDDSSIVPGLIGGVALIDDVKTTSNLDYALTVETLSEDVQAMLYTANVMLHGAAPRDALDLVWTYVRTRKPHRTKRIHLPVRGQDNVYEYAQGDGAGSRTLVSIGSKHVVEQFLKIDAIGEIVAATKLARPKVDDLPPNPRMCDAYGGCPFRGQCNLSPSVHAAAWNNNNVGIIGEQSMSLPTATNDFMASLRAKVPAPAPTAPALPSNVVPPVADVAPAAPAWLAAPVDPMKAKIDASYGVRPPAINPPESALPPAAPVGVVPASVAAAPATVEAPAKRTRRTKAEMAAAREVETPTINASQAVQAMQDSEPLGPVVPDLLRLVPEMRNLGVKRLDILDGKVCGVELFDALNQVQR